MIVRNFALDIVLGLLAIVASSLVLAGGIDHLSAGGPVPSNAARFLLVAVVPAVLFSLLPRRRGALQRIMHTVLWVGFSTLLSLVLLFLLGTVQRMPPESVELLLTGLAFFAGLKLVIGLAGVSKDLVPGLAQKVLIVGEGALAEKMGRMGRHKGGRFNVLGRVDCPECLDNRKKADCSTLLRVAKNFMADKVVVSLAERRGVLPMQEMLACKLGGIDVLDAPSFYEQVNQKLLLENITPSWFIFNPGFRVGWGVRAVKRIMDIALSLVGMVATLPLVPLVILAIKLDSPGPVLFSQVRVGAGDEPFTLHKFRTMRSDAEKKTGAVWSQANDPRITKVGKFLRKSRLDEIPQLVNILQGTMSMVGPRPERPEFVRELKERIPYYSERHTVKPGLTGWAQVSYPYGSSIEDALEKLRYDLYYIKHLSLRFDLAVIVRTISVVLLGKGGR